MSLSSRGVMSKKWKQSVYNENMIKFNEKCIVIIEKMSSKR